MSDQIHFLTLLDISARIRGGALTSVAVTEALLQRIEQLNPRLQCFLKVLPDTALAAARNADREIAAGFWRGPLHGVPLALKDILHMKGLATSAGTKVLMDFPAQDDATVVARLQKAGAVLLGKLHMTEGAGLAHHPEYPRPTNPWNADYWTGVSSSGSGIAVAAGLCYGAIGTDTGGSIRMPSSVHNLTGIKPTWGRVSRYGLVPLIESLDHVGPMARSVGDAAAILQAIAGLDDNDATSLCAPVPNYLAALDEGIGDICVGIDRRFVAGIAPEVAQALANTEKTLRDLGCRVRDITFPSTENLLSEVSMPMVVETGLAHTAHFPAQADRYGPWLRGLLEAAQKMDGYGVAKGYMARDRFRGQVNAVFRDVDIILVPAFADVTPTWDAMDKQMHDMLAMGAGLMKFQSPFNAAATPVLSLPAGFTANGMPIGVQLVGGHLTEARLCAVGHAFQRITDYHTRHPEI